MTGEQIGDQIPHGPDPEPYLEAIRQFHDAGFRNLAAVPVGDDSEGTVDFFENEILCSDLASFVVGSTYGVDGGSVMSVAT